MNLTDLELQAWAMMSWMGKRPWPTRPSRDVESISKLIELGLVVERPLEGDGDPRGEWEIILTKKGNTFDLLPVLVQIHTHIRCGAWFEAGYLIKTNLPAEELPEFLVHPSAPIREAAKVAIECKLQKSNMTGSN